MATANVEVAAPTAPITMDNPRVFTDEAEASPQALSKSQVSWGRHWMDRPNAAAATLAECESLVPPGWRPLLAQALVKLLAVVDGRTERHDAVGRLEVYAGRAELWCAGVEETDDVIEGILLKMARTSHHVCRCCGRRGRLRRASDLTDANGRSVEVASVLCPRCAAPWLLRHDLRRLAESVPMLRGLGLPVGPVQIPVLLRADFCQQAERLGKLGGRQAKVARMSPQAFLEWARDWQAFSTQLVVDGWA